MSDDLFRGERGSQGDHGQPGARGDRGPRGAKGTAPDPRWYSLTDGRLLVIFAIVVLIGVLFIQGLARQQNELSKAQDAIKTNLHTIEEARYQSCLNGVNIIIKFNTNQERFKELAIERPDLDPAVKQDLVNAYNQSIFEIPDCSSLNPDKK